MQNRLLINVISSVGQVVISGFTYFLLYGIWIRELGVKQLGIWSIVWTTTYLAAMANSGVPVGIVKFIAEAHIQTDMERAKSVITLSIAITALLNFVICLILYFNAPWLFHFLFSATDAAIALQIFPLALVAFWLLNISNVFVFTLDGFQVNYLRSVLNVLASFILFTFAYIFLDSGLWGIVIAHLVYTIFLLVGGISLVIYHLKTPLILNFKIDKQLFIDFFKYSLKSQAGSITTLLYDPITKFFLVRYGSLDAVGFYEMANRLVTQIRSVIVTANQVMVPKIVETSLNATNNFQRLYAMMFKLLVIVSTPLLFLLFFFAPFISFVWIGKVEPFFVLSIYMLVIGWYINTLSVPAYISNLGVGQLRHNVIHHGSIAFLNILFGFVGGYFLNSYGVVSGWSLSLVLSAGLLIYLFHQKHQLDFHILRFEGDSLYVVSLIVLTVSACFINYLLAEGAQPWFLLFVGYSGVYIAWLYWIFKSIPLIRDISLRFSNFRFK